MLWFNSPGHRARSEAWAVNRKRIARLCAMRQAIDLEAHLEQFIELGGTALL
jgi:hypothetical protein